MSRYFNDAYFSHFALSQQSAASCTLYKLLKWKVSYFLSQWDANVGTVKAGTILRYNNLYHVQFCSDVSLTRLRSLAAENPDAQLLLSFRKSGNMPALVLVQISREGN